MVYIEIEREIIGREKEIEIHSRAIAGSSETLCVSMRESVREREIERHRDRETER